METNARQHQQDEMAMAEKNANIQQIENDVMMTAYHRLCLQPGQIRRRGSCPTGESNAEGGSPLFADKTSGEPLHQSKNRKSLQLKTLLKPRKCCGQRCHAIERD
jgi:hypothetical protein